MTTVLVDAENTRRSRWPNISGRELVERCRAWADSADAEVVVVFDGDAPTLSGGPRVSVVGTEGESADDWIARRAAELRAEGRPFWLVTSDRELRARAGPGAERLIGGGSFVHQLTSMGASGT
jgi:predicted RNA-binding protein with PIN domain